MLRLHYYPVCTFHVPFSPDVTSDDWFNSYYFSGVIIIIVLMPIPGNLPFTISVPSSERKNYER